MKLQQRPEADDVRAMQQQLSSLHLVMEQTSSEHELETEKVRGELRGVELERDRLSGEVEAAKKEIEDLPKVEDMKR